MNPRDSTRQAPMLEIREGKLRARWPGDPEDTPVKLLLARPLTAPDGPVSVVDEQKHERALLPAVSAFDPDSRRLAEAELAQRYFRPAVRAVLAVSLSGGNRFVHVTTDRGERRFAMRDPHRNIVWITPDRLLLIDITGTRYEVRSWRSLDAVSRKRLERIM